MRLNLDQLEAFADVVELGSFSLAARRLNLTQPAISLRIKQLEHDLGMKLVESVGRRTKATPAGNILYDQIHKIDAALAGAVDALANFHSDVRERVVIGTGASACIYLLPPILRMLKQRYPGLELVIRTGSTADIMKWVEDGSVDVAVMSLTGPHRAMHTMPVFTDELIGLVPAGEPVRRAHLTALDLCEKPLIMPPRGGGTDRLIKAWFEEAHLGYRPIMELGSIEAIKRLVAAQLGYAIIPRIALADAKDRLRWLPLSPPIYRILNIVARNDKLLSHGIREVMAALEGLKAAPVVGSEYPS